jgi:hypothetical protein
MEIEEINGKKVLVIHDTAINEKLCAIWNSMENMQCSEPFKAIRVSFDACEPASATGTGGGPERNTIDALCNC